MTCQVGKTSSNVLQVQGTNDNSIVSKLSMVNKGYIDDNYLKCFVKKPQRRSPLINRGYYIRTKAIRYVLSQYLKEMSSQIQIVSLGAGFDTTFFWIKDNLKYNAEKQIKYVEIDYPAVMRRKVMLAKSYNLFLDDEDLTDQSSNSNIVFRNKEYTAVGFDLRQAGSELTKTLKSCGIDTTVPTLFLSEVVLTYITSSQSNNVLKWVNHAFSEAVMLVFEQMLPQDGFGKVMLRHFETMGSPLLTIGKYPTLDAQQKRHKSFGFTNSSAKDLHQFYTECLSPEEKKRVSQIEMFDEFEGWHQMCLHYFIMCSTNSQESSLQTFCKTCLNRKSSLKDLHDEQKITNKPELIQVQLNSNITGPCLFGHCAIPIGQDVSKVLILGGFGIQLTNQTNKNGKFDVSHKRIDRPVLFDFENGQGYELMKAEKLSHPMHCTTILATNHGGGCTKIVIFGGRTSPKSASNAVTVAKLSIGDGDFSLESFPISSQSKILPSARWRHSAVRIETASSETMLLFGGRNQNEVYGDCWSFDLNSHDVTQLKLDGDTEVLGPRHSHSCAFWRKHTAVVSGGLDGSETPLNGVFSIELDTSGSATVVRLEIHPQLDPLYSHTSHVFEERYLALIGGVRFPPSAVLHARPHSLLDQIQLIDLDSRAWCKTFAIDQPGPERPLMLHGHVSVVLSGRTNAVELLVLGGGSNCFSFGTAFNSAPIRVRFALK